MSREGVMGIRPRNKEQIYALDLLLEDSIRLVTLVGLIVPGETVPAVRTNQVVYVDGVVCG